jgi:hypothetical protein
MNRILRRCAGMLRDWKLIHEEEASRLELLAEALERRGSEPARITWDPG